MTNFTLYSKERCVQCDATKRKMTELGVVPTVVDAAEPSVVEHLQELGYQQVPVVVAPDGSHWSGYQPDLLAEHVRLVVS